MTGTSDHSLSQEELASFGKETVGSVHKQSFVRLLPLALTLLLGLVVLVTPLAFVVLPQLLWAERVQSCGPACEGLFLSLAFKLLILMLAGWALFLRPPRSTLPRLAVYRALLAVLTLLLLVSYWLFYGVRILDTQVCVSLSLSTLYVKTLMLANWQFVSMITSIIVVYAFQTLMTSQHVYTYLANSIY